MKKIIDSINEAVAQKASETTHKVLGRLMFAERLLVFGFGLIGLSIFFAHREEQKQARKDSRKSNTTGSHS